MHHALELRFDSGTEEAILGIWRGLEAAGLGSTMLNLGARPHLSLAVCDAPVLADAGERLLAFFAAEPALPVTFASVGSFPGDEGVVFLAPIVTGELLGLHARYHADFAHLCTSARPYYLPGAWAPHCTVGFNVSAKLLPAALEFARTAELPLRGRITRAQAIEFEAGSTRPVRTCLDADLAGIVAT